MFRFLLLLLLLLTPSIARAEPMFTPLPKVYAQTESVVIARWFAADQPKNPRGLGPAVIRVDEVIQGKMGLGKLTVGLCGGHASVPQKQAFVAFLNKRNEFCFAAVPLSGGSVHTGLLQMRGFYDFNAHIVSPAMASVPQIRAALKGKPYTFSFRGKLHVLDPKTRTPTPTRHEISGSCVFDLKKGCVKTNLQGLEWMKGVPAPKLSMSAWDPAVQLTSHTGWPRPLVLKGALSGWDAKRREHTLRFQATMPDLFTTKHLETYLRDPKIAYGLWHYRLKFKDGTTWTMSDGHEYSGGLRLKTNKGAQFGYDSFSFYAEERKVTFKGAGAPVLEFESPPDDPKIGGTFRRFHRAAILGGVTFRVLRGPRKGERGKLELVRVEWKEAVRAP